MYVPNMNEDKPGVPSKDNEIKRRVSLIYELCWKLAVMSRPHIFPLDDRRSKTTQLPGSHTRRYAVLRRRSRATQHPTGPDAGEDIMILRVWFLIEGRRFDAREGSVITTFFSSDSPPLRWPLTTPPPQRVRPFGVEHGRLIAAKLRDVIGRGDRLRIPDKKVYCFLLWCFRIGAHRRFLFLNSYKWTTFCN